jgi:AcrR family transcriptional regulator
LSEHAPASRRDEYAEMTRQEVVRAARTLFAAHGYAQTTVEKIGREARVSPATIYAQCGGKEGLLRALMDKWTTGDLITRIIADCAAADTGRAKMQVLADGYVKLYAESGDIIHIVTRAASSSPPAAEFLEVADQRHQEALRTIIEGIRGVGDLAEELTVDDAVKIVFFHFRHAQFSLTAETFGWGVDRAAQWIRDRTESAILKG